MQNPIQSQPHSPLLASTLAVENKTKQFLSTSFNERYLCHSSGQKDVNENLLAPPFQSRSAFAMNMNMASETATAIL